MRSIEAAFRGTHPAAIPFIMVGDPTLEQTVQYVEALVDAGVSLIELGVPYSDPLADGPTIQNAAARALKQAITLEHVFQLIATIRTRGITIPLILLTYYNPVLQYGVEPFFQQLKAAGGNGVIIPDLPYEESGEALQFSLAYEVALIPMVAPTSQERLAQILKGRVGFVYAVSSLGVTGKRQQFATESITFLQQVRRFTELPICVGFGISRPEHVQQFAPYVDGIIVGSALVEHLHQGKPPSSLMKQLFQHGVTHRSTGTPSAF